MWPFHRRAKAVKPRKRDVFASESGVHPKSSTQPLARQRVVQTPLHEVLLTIIFGDQSWDATYALLEQHLARLLSDDALVVLDRQMQRERESDQPIAGDVAAYIGDYRQMLVRAREVGLPQAWAEFRAAHPQPRQPPPEVKAEIDAIIAAVKALLGTDSWDATRIVLVREQRRLLTDQADQLLAALIAQAQRDPDPRARENARYLELHRVLLREAREVGVDRAWEQFEQARRELERQRTAGEEPPAASFAEAVSEALKQLLTTDSWDQTHTVLEREAALLLTPLCDQMLGDLIAAARADDDPRAAKGITYLELHRDLLRRARQEGIPAAWEALQRDLARASSDTPPRPPPTAPAPIAGAVQQFLGLASWAEARTFLEAHQRELLAPEAEALVQAEAERLRQRGTGRDVYAARLLDLQAKLLRRAREIGVPRAWVEFEAER